MNSDTLIRQLTQADAYAPDHDLPETARTSTVALTEIRRRIDMDAKEITRPVEPEPPRQRRGWLVGAAAFAVVLVVAAAVWMVQPGTVDDAVTDSTQPTVTEDMSDAAEEIADAIYAGDWAAIEPMVSEDFGDGISTDGLDDLTADGFRAVVAFYATDVDTRAVDFTCRDTGFGGLVMCDIAVEDPRFELPDDFRSDQLLFEFRDGLLTDARPHWDFRWAEALAEIGGAADPEGYDVSCRETLDSRTINGVTYNGACGAFLAPYNDALVASLGAGDAQTSDGVPPMTPADQEVIDAFERAVNVADLARIEALFTADATWTTADPIREAVVADGSFAALVHAYYATEGSTYMLENCTAVEAGILCESTWSGIVPRATFGVDYTGRETFTIVDGSIASMRHTPRQWPSSPSWLDQGRLDLIEWVRTINPGDADALEASDASYGGFRLDVAPLWLSYAEQWIEAGRP